MKKHLLLSSRRAFYTKAALTVIGILSLFAGYATTYYSATGGGASTTVTNWWTNNNNTGSQPANFTTAGDIFIVQSAMTASGWAVTGTVQVNSNTLTISSTSTVGGLTIGGGTLTLNAGLTVNGAWAYNSGTFTPNSQTVTFGTGGTIAGTVATTFNSLAINTTNTTDIVFLNIAQITIKDGGTLFLTKGILNVGTGHTIQMGTSSATTIDASGGGNFATTGTNGADGGNIDVRAGSGGLFTVKGTGSVGSPTFYNVYNGSASDANWRFTLNNPGVKVNGTLSASTLAGASVANANQWATQTNSPVYGPNSTLIVNRNGQGWAPSLEWTAQAPGVIGTTAGYPNNVTLLNMGGSQNNGTGFGPSGTWSINGTLAIGNSSIAGSATLQSMTAFTCGGILIDNGSTLKHSGETFTVKGNWTQQGTTTGIFSIVSGTTPVTFAGSGTSASPQIITSTGSSTSISSINSITINNGTYVKLNCPVTLPTTGTLTLTSGILQTDATNILNITNTAVAAISGTGSATNCITGPVKRSLLSSGTNIYIFPIAAGTSTITYMPLTLNSKNTTASNVATAQVFTGTPGGSGLSTGSTTEYWSLTTSSGLGTTGSTVSVTRPSAIAAGSVIGKSATLTGSYASIGGTVSGTGPASINGSSDILTTSPWFFVIGAVASPTVTIATNGTQSAGSPVLNTTKNIIYSFTAAPTAADALLTGFNFTTTGSVVAADITQYQLWYNPGTNNFTNGATVAIGTITGIGNASSTAFTSFVSKTITNGTTGYFWITADITSGAIAGHTITVSALNAAGSNFTIAAAVYSAGTIVTGGLQTITATAPTVITGVASAISAAGATLNGTVNANLLSTTTNFDYGTSVTYGNNVAGSPVSLSTNTATAVTSSISALIPNTLYHFRINGVVAGVSTNGSDATFTTISNAPVVGVGTTATVNGFTANWSAPATQGSATYTYTVDVSADNTFATGVTTQTGISSGTLSYTFTTLSSSTSGITYYYRVKAVNAGGSSAVSATSAGIATLPYPYSWYNANYVAGPFYIKNDYTGFGFQYLYDTLSVANNYTGTEDGNNGSDASSYSNYGRVVRNVNATESSIPYLNNQSYMWVIEKDPISGYYEIKNIVTGRYFHTGAYGDYYNQDGNNNSLNVFAYNSTLTNGATGANSSSQANIELSYYCFTLPSGVSNTSFTSQIVDQRFAWGQRTLHGELSSTHANAPRPTMVFFTDNSNVWGTKTWDFNIASLKPSLVATVATNIATTTTTIGGNVTYAGSSGATVTATGFKYSTVSTFDPSTTGTNIAVGSGLGAFSANLTALSASTKYYYYAYATNSTGTAYSQKDSVFTLSALPTTQPTTFTSDCPQVTLSWSATAGLPTSAQAPRIGYIILRTSGGTAPSLTSGVNRYAPYSALFNANLPAGVSIIDSISYLNASLPNGTLSFHDTVSVIGTYNYQLVPYTYDGIPADSTYNYFISGTKFLNSVTTIKAATWLGKNNNWNDATNWCNGSVPTATTNVVIPAGLVTYPYLGTAGSSTSGYADSLSLGFGASLTIGAGGSLSISGNITNTGGIFNAIAGTIVTAGSSAQTITGSSFINQTVYSLMDSTTSGGLFIDSLNIIGELGFPYAGTSSLTISKNVVLISNALSTAWVGPIAESGGVARATITGNVIVQRYFPAHRRWRLITAPVTAASAQTINAAWQEGVVSTTTPVSANPDPLPGYGTHITGPSHTTYAAGLGYDQSPANSASIAYVADTAAWYALPNTNVTKVTDYQGYMLFVRGSRNYNIGTTAQTTAATAATLRTTGSLKTGLQNISVSAGPNVVGNPYATTINFNTIYARNAAILGTNTFYLWSPDIASASNVASGTGGWVVLTTNGTGGYIAVPTPINSFNTNGDIQSGAAFMVHALSSGTVKIDEADKVSPAATNNDLYLFRPSAPFATLRTTLYGTAADTISYVADGVLNMFDSSFSNDVNWNKDIQKQANLNEQCAIVKNGRLISVQKSLPVNAGDTIHLQMARLGLKSYRVALVAGNFNRPDLSAYLIDTFAHTNTPVSLNGNDTTNVNITITSTAGASAGRFAIAFRAAPGSVTYTTITAVQQNKNALVQWTVSNQLNVKEYILYKSTDGHNFYPVDTTFAASGTASNFVYNWLDTALVEGTTFYKVKNINNDGASQESGIAKLDFAKEPVIAGISIYPNPVVNGVIGLKLNNIPVGDYNISVINAAGQVVLTQTISHEVTTETRDVILNKSAAKGVYLLDIQSPASQTKIKFVNQ